MEITVEDQGFSSDGAGLQSSARSCPVPASCQAPTTDAVSATLVSMFNQWARAISRLLDQSAACRAAAGMSVSATAQVLGGQDEANAAAIAAGGGAAPSGASGVGGLPFPARPLGSVVVPQVPSVSAPPSLTGEQIAHCVHGGPGTASVRELAQTLPHLGG